MDPYKYIVCDLTVHSRLMFVDLELISGRINAILFTKVNSYARFVQFSYGEFSTLQENMEHYHIQKGANDLFFLSIQETETSLPFSTELINSALNTPVVRHFCSNALEGYSGDISVLFTCSKNILFVIK